MNNIKQMQLFNQLAELLKDQPEPKLRTQTEIKMSKLYYSTIHGNKYSIGTENGDMIELSHSQIKRVEEKTGKNIWNVTFWDDADNYYSLVHGMKEHGYIFGLTEKCSIH